VAVAAGGLAAHSRVAEFGGEMKLRVLATLLLGGLGCGIKPPVAGTRSSDPGTVNFDIAALPGEQRWEATYTSQGKTAKFIVELGAGKAAENSPLPNLKFGQGRLVAVKGSDASSLLEELKRALEAKQLPANVVRAPSVTFTYADLGEQDHWRMIKLFFGEGDGESEVFLNLNPTLRKGQFSIKDSDYGDAVLAELAKVL
jgi:hypothetical protein